MKGLHYRSRWLYHVLTFGKLGKAVFQRFRIAASYIEEGNCVLDVCAADGLLRRFLPPACRYTAIEASVSFARYLQAQGIKTHLFDLHEGLKESPLRVDVIVMVISLCQFHETSAADLLEDFKRIALRVIIVEELITGPDPTWLCRMRDFLCASNHYQPMRLFTKDEFQTLMQVHGYEAASVDQRYWIGTYEKRN